LGEDPVQGGVAQQPLDAAAVESGAVGGAGAGAGEGPVALDVEDDVDVRAMPSTAAGVLVIEEVAADVPQRVGPAAGGAADRFTVAVGGGGEAQGGGQELAGFGAEVGVEPPAAAERGRLVQTVGRFGLGVAVGGGSLAPGPHGGGDIAYRQVDQGGQHRRLVVGEQADGVGVEVGGDGLDLAAGQHPVVPRPGGGG
jgi:hypothetical protein